MSLPALLLVGLLAGILNQGGAVANTDPGIPTRGNYSVKNTNSSICLLALMGVQLNVSYSSASLNKTATAVFNLQPNLTMASGSCDPDSATLRLASTYLQTNLQTNLTFHFSLNTTSNKYHLSGLSLSAVLPDMKEGPPVTVGNDSLDYLRGALGRSFMCHDKQTLSVTPRFSIRTFQLQVQPFGFTGEFGAAEECEVDEDDMLIPIVVGAALAALVLIVLVAYLVGRRRSHAGYQTI